MLTMTYSNSINLYGDTYSYNVELHNEVAAIRTITLITNFIHPTKIVTKTTVTATIENTERAKFFKLTHEMVGPPNFVTDTGIISIGVRDLNLDQLLGKFIMSVDKGISENPFSIEVNSIQAAGRSLIVSVTGFGLKDGQNRVQYEGQLDMNPGKKELKLLGGYQYSAGPRQYIQASLESTKDSRLKKHMFDVAADLDYKEESGPKFQAKGTVAYKFISVTDFEV